MHVDAASRGPCAMRMPRTAATAQTRSSTNTAGYTTINRGGMREVEGVKGAPCRARSVHFGSRRISKTKIHLMIMPLCDFRFVERPQHSSVNVVALPCVPCPYAKEIPLL